MKCHKSLPPPRHSLNLTETLVWNQQRHLSGRRKQQLFYTWFFFFFLSVPLNTPAMTAGHDCMSNRCCTDWDTTLKTLKMCAYKHIHIHTYKYTHTHTHTFTHTNALSKMQHTHIFHLASCCSADHHPPSAQSFIIWPNTPLSYCLHQSLMTVWLLLCGPWCAFTMKESSVKTLFRSSAAMKYFSFFLFFFFLRTVLHKWSAISYI